MSLECRNTSGFAILSRRRALFVTGWFFSFMAGSVNGIAMAAIVFDRTSHLSGRVNDLFRNLVFDLPKGILVACIIYSFVTGAVVAGWLAPRVGVARSLLLTSAALAFSAVLIWTSDAFGNKETYNGLRYILAAMLAFGAGVQNGSTSQIKIGRTTHVTGDLTDMGIAISAADWFRAAFLFTKHIGFAAGGVAGFMGLHYFTPAALLLACATLIKLAVLTLLLLDRHLWPPARKVGVGTAGNSFGAQKSAS